MKKKNSWLLSNSNQGYVHADITSRSIYNFVSRPKILFDSFVNLKNESHNKF